MKRSLQLIISLLLLLTLSLPPLIEAQGADDGKKPAPSGKNVDEGKMSEADKEEIDKPIKWPTTVRPPRNLRMKASGKKPKRGEEHDGYHYETINYIFHSPVKLSTGSQKAIARLFECAYAANMAISKAIPIHRAKKRRPSKDKLKARLFATMDDYVAAGASANSAGVFRSTKRMGVKSMKEKDIIDDEVLVPFDSIGINPDGSLQGRVVDSHVLVHEITHQCTALNNLPIWANEGMSEYVGYVPYDGYKLNFNKCYRTIVNKAKSQGDMEFPFSLHEFLTMEQEEAYAYMGAGVNTYLLSVMCVCYFVHMEQNLGVRNFRSYLSDTYRGKDKEKALSRLYARDKKPEKFQKTFETAWAVRGVDIKFAKYSEKK